MQLDIEQLEQLCRIAEAAGEQIMAVYAGEFETWTKSDDSPLTEADLRADRVIRDGLERHFPGMFILSEESRSASAIGEAFFLVDPLDGTKEFLKRNGEFTVNIALVRRGEVIAGVVFAPALGELFYAARGLGAWARDRHGSRPLHVVDASPKAPLRIIGSRSHGSEALAAWLVALRREHVFEAAGSSLKFCRIAEGRADMYPRFGPTSQWDTAAAQGILEAAGGTVTDFDGVPLRYGLDRPIVNPDFVAIGPRALIDLVATARR